ncbi:hypothetical protein D9615_008518 [Tricholomella constricta]|uniref:DUF6533 domain-containing protein n=1 Tax=Tricholomella constricta TaxID=117010 RepID=A0A8H5M0M6_9AGAR|nr:hypothetical protein D9615_008518 [Tricholomella constricta]
MDALGLEMFLGLLEGYIAVRYTNVAFLMLLVYDHIITFDDEVSKIWTLPWRLPKVLFLVNRYIIPPMLLSLRRIDTVDPAGKPNVRPLENWRVTFDAFFPRCVFIAKWTTWPTILSIGTVDIILILRDLHVQDGQPKKLTRFLVGLFVVTLAAWLGIAMTVMAKTSSMPGGELFTGCLFSAPSYFYSAWIPPVCFEIVIIALTVYKVMKYETMSPTLRVLARDSIVYFAFIFFILLANLFIARYGRGFLGALMIVPCSVVACIAAARMTMNIRDSTMKKCPEGSELPTIDFCPGEAPTQDRQESATLFSDA